MVWNRKRHTGTTARVRHELEREPFAVQMPQARAGIADPDTLARSGWWDATTIVDDLAAEHVAVGCNGEAHVAGAHAVAEPVAQRVLDERLQHQRRDARIEHFGIDVERDRSAITKPQTHDLEVALQEIDLLAKLGLLYADAAQGHAKQIAE